MQYQSDQFQLNPHNFVIKWNPLTTINGWTSIAALPAEYAVTPDGFTHLRGNVTGGTTGTVAFALPEHATPRRAYTLPVYAAGSAPPARLEVATDGTVTPYYSVLHPHYSVSHTVGSWQYFHITTGFTGAVAGTGVFAYPGGGWSSLSNDGVTGYSREYRFRAQLYYNPGAGTTACNYSVQFVGGGGNTTSVLFAVPFPGTPSDHSFASTWFAANNINGETSAYLGHKADWATAIGTVTVRQVSLDVRYVSTTAASLSLDGLAFHRA